MKIRKASYKYTFNNMKNGIIEILFTRKSIYNNWIAWKRAWTDLREAVGEIIGPIVYGIFLFIMFITLPFSAGIMLIINRILIMIYGEQKKKGKLIHAEKRQKAVEKRFPNIKKAEVKN